MLKIALKPVPNQSLIFEHGNNRYEIEIKTAIQSVFVNIKLNDVMIEDGRRVVSGVPIIHNVTAAQFGNFFISGKSLCYENFGNTSDLYFIDELIIKKPIKLLSDNQKRMIK